MKQLNSTKKIPQNATENGNYIIKSANKNVKQDKIARNNIQNSIICFRMSKMLPSVLILDNSFETNSYGWKSKN